VKAIVSTWGDLKSSEKEKKKSPPLIGEKEVKQFKLSEEMFAGMISHKNTFGKSIKAFDGIGNLFESLS